MQNQPIGIFDSGVGGITILNAIKNLLPNENIIYLSDNFNSPYGEKSNEQINYLSKKNTDWLLSKNCKLIVVACNTATTNSISYLRNLYDINFIGVEPAIKPAALNTKTGSIGVLATKGTLSSQLFNTTSNDYCDNINIIEKNGDGLVELIENGIISGNELQKLLNKYIQPMIKSNIDHLVLGCTHYPLIKESIEKILPDSVKILESGEAVAKQTKKILKENNLLNQLKSSKFEFYCNSSTKTLENLLDNRHTINSINYE